LIGGRKVPDYTLNRSRDVAKEIELTKIDDKQVWLDWIRQKYESYQDNNQLVELWSLRKASQESSALPW
jgi:hypothetical protein